MWHGLWPEPRVDQVPITSVTNGVHQRTWISGELEVLLGDTDPQFERARDACGGGSVGRAPQREGAPASLHRRRRRGARELDPDVLTIGFARRFATYKRASLLFSRPERLALLLADPERPIQVLVAGKAHPADEEGKDLIQLVVDFAREPAAARARRLPRGLRDDARAAARAGRRPVAQHAAAAARGVGHLGHEGRAERRAQLLDPRRLVGRGVLAGLRVRDRRRGGRWTEASRTRPMPTALYAVLEEQVLPAYYERDEGGLPQRWIALMRESIAELGPRFGTARMAAEYVERLYLPRAKRAQPGRVPSRVGLAEDPEARPTPRARLLLCSPLRRAASSARHALRPSAAGRRGSCRASRAARRRSGRASRSGPANEHDGDERRRTRPTSAAGRASARRRSQPRRAAGSPQAPRRRRRCRTE